MTRSGLIVGLSAVLLLLLMVLPGSNCRILPRTGPQLDMPLDIPHDTIAAGMSMDMDSFAVTERVGHVVKFRLYAEKAQQLLSGDAPLQRMVVVFYNNDTPTLELRADSGVFHGKTRDITLQDNVVATGLVNPVRFFTRDLYWDNAREIMRTPGRVRVEREGMVMTGTGLIADKTLQRLELQRDVQTEFQ